MDVTASDINELLEESVKMKMFDHPNVLNLIGVCVDAGPSPYIVMPYMENGSLLSYLKRERPKLTIVEGAEPELVTSYKAGCYGLDLNHSTTHILLVQSLGFPVLFSRHALVHTTTN